MIMEEQHMTQQVFADFLQQSPATLSSIFNGRTRPTLNVVDAIKTKIPDISIEWLLYGIGDMHTSHPDEPNAVSQDTQMGGMEQMLNFDAPSSAMPQMGAQAASYQGVKGAHVDYSREDVRLDEKPPRKVTEIRVYYDDQTYETFIPAKK